MRTHRFGSLLLLALSLLATMVMIATVPALAVVPSVSNTVSVSANNQFTANGDGTMTVVTAVQTPIPTLSVVGLVALAALLAGFAFLRLRRPARQRA